MMKIIFYSGWLSVYYIPMNAVIFCYNNWTMYLYSFEYICRGLSTVCWYTCCLISKYGLIFSMIKSQEERYHHQWRFYGSTAIDNLCFITDPFQEWLYLRLRTNITGAHWQHMGPGQFFDAKWSLSQHTKLILIYLFFWIVSTRILKKATKFVSTLSVSIWRLYI